MSLRVPEPLIPVVLRARRSNQPFVTAEGARRRLRERFLRPAPYGPPADLKGVCVERRLDSLTGWPVYDVEPAGPIRHAADPSPSTSSSSSPSTVNAAGPAAESDASPAVPSAAGARAPAATGPKSVVVYLHGGGWVHEIAVQHWRLIARIARETGQRVIVPIHPLLPQGTARAVRDGVLTLIRAELEAGCEVRLCGDSSGGQISLSAALALRDEGIVLPGTTLLSPALDLTWSNPRIDAVQPSDPWLARPGGRVLAEAWRGADGIEDPLVSPLFAEMRGLGPLTILTGTRDVLNPDAHLLRTKAEQAGVQVRWCEADGQVHVYALLPSKAGEQGAHALVESLTPR